jgi:uncharacterized protein
MFAKRHPLRINIGYVVHESAGYKRSLQFEFPLADLGDDVLVTNFSAEIELSRTQEGILVKLSLSGSYPGECARCLDSLESQINAEFTELYSFASKVKDDADLVVPDDGLIDFTDSARDYWLLAIPINRLCKINCEGLCPICGTNHNHHDCDCDTEVIDPRLEKLRKLLDNSEE